MERKIKDLILGYVEFKKIWRYLKLLFIISYIKLRFKGKCELKIGIFEFRVRS